MPQKKQQKKKGNKKQTNVGGNRKRRTRMRMKREDTSIPTAYASIVGRSQRRITTNSYERVRVEHCEMFTEVSTTVSFQATEYPIQFPNTNMFPWGSEIAKRYQKYRLTRLNYIYLPSCGTTKSGNIDLVVQLDVDGPEPATLMSLMQYENKVTSSLFVPAELSVPQSELNNFKELWVSESLTQGGAPRLNSPGNLYVNAVSSDTAAVVGRLYVDYEVEFFDPVPFGTNPSVLGSDYYTDSAPASYNDSDIVWPAISGTVTDRFVGAPIIFKTISVPIAGGSKMTRAVVINQAQDISIDSSIDANFPASMGVGDLEAVPWTTIFRVIDVAGNIIQALPAAYQSITSGVYRIIAGVKILASAFTGNGPWTVSQYTSSDSYSAFESGYWIEDTYIQVGYQTPAITQFDARVARLDALQDGGLANGYYRLQLAGGAGLDEDNIFGTTPTAQLENIAVDSWASNVLALSNVALGPYTLVLSLDGTFAGLDISATATGATLGSPISAIKDDGSMSLYISPVYVTNSAVEFTFSGTGTSVTATNLFFGPSVAYLAL
jgi:hypothetical protein